MENSKTGDLLLYTTHGFFPRVTRGATNSNYDHVGMVVKSINKSDPQDQVYIFEAVGDAGVRICDWKDVREDVGRQEDGKAFSNIVYRSVDFNREDNLTHLYRFFRDHLGKDYGLSI